MWYLELTFLITSEKNWREGWNNSSWEDWKNAPAICTPLHFCTQRRPLFYQRFFLFYVNYWLANLVGGPLWDPTSISLTALSVRPSPVTAVFRARVLFSLCVHACMSSVSCLCVSCVCVSAVAAGVGEWVGGKGGGGRVLGCISTGAGLGHINILINMRESITGEERA